MLDRLRHGHVLRCGPRNWPLPVPLPGEGRGGRVSLHAANCADPPQEGSVPLRIPPSASDESGGWLFRLALTSLSG